MIFPKIESFTVDKGIKLGRDFVFVDGQHILQDNGTPAIANDRENIENWCRKVITTMLGVYEVYTKGEKDSFGISVYDRLGTKEKAYWASEFKREVTEQLTKHNCIEAVKDFTAEFVRRDIIIKFTVVVTEGVLSVSTYNIDYANMSSGGSGYDPYREIIIKMQTRIDALQKKVDSIGPIPIEDVERICNEKGV